ncbi:AAA family ATPase [Methanococcus voltae]|uniref:AAA ATPase central domain protein n=1 Tax=Methanococcus voltae (strain ATCC BAA-1334 / A3) TaxID=456320 RepID=D7DVA4_METV3|nr:AAA family ATPase [Methanococcus voltae]MCS3901702.1 AAA family ATPase [Methanococcus voltae]
MKNITFNSIKLKSAPQKIHETPENSVGIKYVILEPVGFPIKINGENIKVTVEDGKLFNQYARDQWENEIIKEGDYLFDNSIIPDYAFKVLSIYPKDGEITTKETIYKLNTPLKNEVNNIKKTYFEEIIGQEHAKKKCKIIMKYLEKPEIFGEWSPKNILFYGSPGTGKTMLARALASQTNSNLKLIKATELIGEHVGDSSKVIKGLYADAAANKPCIIFIDEIDAIALSRNYQSLRGDVSEVVNALLTELDGIHENEGVITIAATNNPDMLDLAVRSRFEEEILFKIPNEKERLEILKTYSKKLPIKTNVDFKKYVKKTEGMNGRTLKEKLLKPLLHKAIIEELTEISEKDFEETLNRLINQNTKNVPSELYN